MLRAGNRQILGFLAEEWPAGRRRWLLGLGLGHLQQHHLGRRVSQWRSRHELLEVAGFVELMAG